APAFLLEVAGTTFEGVGDRVAGPAHHAGGVLADRLGQRLHAGADGAGRATDGVGDVARDRAGAVGDGAGDVTGSVRDGAGHAGVVGAGVALVRAAVALFERSTAGVAHGARAGAAGVLAGVALVALRVRHDRSSFRKVGSSHRCRGASIGRPRIMTAQ